MNLELSPEALEFGGIAVQAAESAGGFTLVQRAEIDPASRQAAGDVFGSIGAWDLDVRASSDELEAGAALCRAAGWWALPYPVAEHLAQPRGSDRRGLMAVSEHRPAGWVAGLDGAWSAVTPDGRRWTGRPAAPGPSGRAARKSALVAPFSLEADGTATDSELALILTLPCWTLLGFLDRAIEMVRAYVTDRKQFGQPLASFQGVQFQLTDAEVERAGLEELAKYTLWSVGSGRPEAADDAWALRLAALEAADVVFRVAHQLHGAIGFCDETDLSWLSRYGVPYRRLPLGVAGTRQQLVQRVDGRGLTGLFGPGR